ncbi:ABC transporter permease [Wenjunlia tyrosinilytica]|uniref:ABC transporter permease n=1 Tax=Wenjunlia tyrosinilytica TaxID=1544741 RepID=UPI001E64D1FD|nr:ABC transporter permease [Wenjunlia tyrosinilytica]
MAFLVLALSLSTDTFLTADNLVNLLDQATVTGLLACGATVCLLAGAFDLAMGGTLALSAITFVAVTRATGVPLGMAAAVAVGLALGTLNGLVVVGVRVHSFIATLALGIAYGGVALIVTDGDIVYPLSSRLSEAQVLARPTAAGGITVASFLLVVVTGICWALSARTAFGRHMYAVGGNAEAARRCGVRIDAVRVAVLAISGVCAALAGLVLASRAGSAQADMGAQLPLSAIAAAVVGGTSVLGGRGAVWRGLVGVALLTLIGNGFNLLGWNSTYRQLIEGLLILGAIAVDRPSGARR